MRDEIDQLIADLIVQGRRNHNFTQEELAGLIEVDHRTIQRWEYGESTPQPSKVDALIIILPEIDEALKNAIKKKIFLLWVYPLILAE